MNYNIQSMKIENNLTTSSNLIIDYKKESNA